jgi:hypothetical protein
MFVAISLNSAPASAEDAQFYGGIAAGNVTLTKLGLGDMSGNLVALRAGYRHNSYFGAEVEYGQSSETLQRSFISVWDFETTSGFLVGSYPVSESFSVHARGGFQLVRYKLRNSAIAAPIDIVSRIDDTNPAIGVGATWRITDSLDLRGDYTKSSEDIFSSDKRDVQTSTLSLQWRF